MDDQHGWCRCRSQSKYPTGFSASSGKSGHQGLDARFLRVSAGCKRNSEDWSAGTPAKHVGVHLGTLYRAHGLRHLLLATCFRLAALSAHVGEAWLHDRLVNVRASKGADSSHTRFALCWNVRTCTTHGIWQQRQIICSTCAMLQSIA
jgi:hypothetical protein